MRRDLLITAFLFTAIGFAGGYFYSQEVAQHGLRPGVAPAPAAASSAAGQEMEGLPAGHPPMDMAQQWQTLQQHAEQNPRDARAAIELANFLYDRERWEPAITWYQRGLELAPDDANARTDMATCYFNLNRYEEALTEYSRALEKEPNKPQALYGLALARLHGQQDHEGAREAYQQLLRTSPDFPGVQLLEQALAGAQP